MNDRAEAYTGHTGVSARHLVLRRHLRKLTLRYSHDKLAL